MDHPQGFALATWKGKPRGHKLRLVPTGTENGWDHRAEEYTFNFTRLLYLAGVKFGAPGKRGPL